MLRTPSRRPATGVARVPARVSSAVGVAHVDQEEREPASSRTGALRAGQGERHVGRHRRGEPFGSVEPPSLRGLARNGLRESDVGASAALGHPLPGDPGACGIARGEPRDDAFAERRLGHDLEGPSAPVRHGERTRVDLGGAVEEIDEGELVQARVLAVRPLVCRRDQPFLDGDAPEMLPRVGHQDLVDAIAPRVPLDERGLLAVRRRRCHGEIPDRAASHAGERRLDRRAHRRRDSAAEETLQHTILVVLIAEHGRGLDERHGRVLLAAEAYVGHRTLSTSAACPARTIHPPGPGVLL